MSDIPEDIRAAARQHCLDAGIDNPFGAEESLVARALLSERRAERERCAKIVEDFMQDDWGITHAGMTIAAAIRSDKGREG